MHNAARYIMGAFAGAAIISGVGIAAAVASSSPEAEAPERAPLTLSQDSPFDGFLARLAAKLGISEAQLRQAIESALAEELQEAADEGLIPEDFADDLKDRIESGNWDEPLLPGLFDDADILPLLPGFENLEGDIEELQRRVAEFLDATEEEIRDLLENGNSLGDIAEAFGKTPEEISQFLLEQYLDLVEDERIPESVRDQMREIVNRLIELYVEGGLTIDRLFDGEWPAFGRDP